MSELKEKAAQALENLRSVRDRYMKDASELYHDSDVNGPGQYLSKVLAGTSKYDTHPMHLQYFTDIVKASGELAQALNELNAGDAPAAAGLAAEGVRILVEPADANHRFLEFAFMADDQYADPLMEYLTDADLTFFHDEFTAHQELYCSVPSQEKSMDHLEKLMRKRGLPLPELTFIQKLKKKFGIL